MYLVTENNKNKLEHFSFYFSLNSAEFASFISIYPLRLKFFSNFPLKHFIKMALDPVVFIRYGLVYLLFYITDDDFQSYM